MWIQNLISWSLLKFLHSGWEGSLLTHTHTPAWCDSCFLTVLGWKDLLHPALWSHDFVMRKYSWAVRKTPTSVETRTAHTSTASTALGCRSCSHRGGCSTTSWYTMSLMWYSRGNNRELFTWQHGVVLTCFCANQACKSWRSCQSSGKGCSQLFSSHRWNSFGEQEVKEVTKWISAEQREMKLILLYFNESSSSFGQGGLPPCQGKGQEFGYTCTWGSFWPGSRTGVRQS